MFLKEIKEDPNKWRTMLCSWMERFYVGIDTVCHRVVSSSVKRSMLPENASSFYFLNGESHSYFKIYMEIKLAKNSQSSPKEKE